MQGKHRDLMIITIIIEHGKLVFISSAAAASSKL